jgi:hypothetical protein
LGDLYRVIGFLIVNILNSLEKTLGLIVLPVEKREWSDGQKVGENFLVVVIIQIVSGLDGRSRKLVFQI